MRFINSMIIVLGAAAMLGVMVPRCTAEEEFTVTDLGTLGGIWSGASAMNEAGEVAGMSVIPIGAQHGFLWDGSEMNDLGTPDDYLVSAAYGLNDLSQVAGSARGPQQSEYAYLRDEGVWTYLGTLPGPGLDYSSATDINNATQVCGYSFTLGPGSALRAWLWEEGTLTDLGTLGGEESIAGAINELGHVVGWSQIAIPDTYRVHACVWDDSGITDLGTLPDDTDSAAGDINEQGQICGTSSHTIPTYPFPTVSRACLWDGGDIIDLGVLPGDPKSAASGINGRGHVVGHSSATLSGGATRAFLWRDGVMTDLNSLISPTSGWVLRSASDINESGQIVGTGTAPNGETHGFLLTPLVSSADDAPGVEVEALARPFMVYPNPTRGDLTVAFRAPAGASALELMMFDVAGRKVRTLVRGEVSEGLKRVRWDGRDDQGQDVAAGVYFARLTAGNRTLERQRVMVLR